MLFANSSPNVSNVHVEHNVNRMCVVDQYDAKDFNLNSAGWTRNDICQLARAQSQSEFDAIMKTLQVLPDKPGDCDGLKISDAINRVKSRYCQSANEIEQYAQLFAEDEQRRLSEVYKSVNEKSSEDSAEVSAEVPAEAPV